jgi:hypothetical protein
LNRSKTIGRIIQHWTPRATTLQGRVAVTNSLLYSQLYYHASSRFLSQTAIHKLFSAPAHRFLWKNRKFHPASTQLMKTRQEGGLNLSNLPARFTALRIKALTSILTRQDEVAGIIRELLNSLIPRACPPLMALIQWPVATPVKKTRLPQFWKQAILDTREFLEITSPLSANQWHPDWTPQQCQEAFLQLPVWNQPQLGTTNIIPDPFSDSKHIKYIHHLLAVHQESICHFKPINGTITSEFLWERCSQWARTLGTDHIPILDPLANPSPIHVINAGAALQWSSRTGPRPFEAPQPLKDITTKQIYRAVVPAHGNQDRLPGTWKLSPPATLPSIDEWNKARIRITCSRLPPVLMESRWRLLMGQIPSNAIRHGWDHTINPNCPRCGQPIETPEHLIWECPWSQELWNLGNLILQQWMGAPTHPITKLEGIWSINPSAVHLGREVTVALIGLTIWRSRWLMSDNPLNSAPSLTSRISLIIDLGRQMEDIAATNLSPKYRQQILTCPLLNKHGKTTPLPMRFLQQADYNQPMPV